MRACRADTRQARTPTRTNVSAEQHRGEEGQSRPLEGRPVGLRRVGDDRGRGYPAEEATEVALPRDQPPPDHRDDHGEHQVLQQPLRVEPGLPGQDQERTEQAEEGAGRPDGGAVLAAEVEHQHRRGQAADEVHRQEAGPADDALERRSEEEQREHVHRQVPDLHVGEDAGHHLPPGPVGDGRQERRARSPRRRSAPCRRGSRRPASTRPWPAGPARRPAGRSRHPSPRWRARRAR